MIIIIMPVYKLLSQIANNFQLTLFLAVSTVMYLLLTPDEFNYKTTGSQRVKVCPMASSRPNKYMEIYQLSWAYGTVVLGENQEEHS